MQKRSKLVVLSAEQWERVRLGKRQCCAMAAAIIQTGLCRDVTQAQRGDNAPLRPAAASTLPACSVCPMAASFSLARLALSAMPLHRSTAMAPESTE